MRPPTREAAVARRLLLLDATTALRETMNRRFAVCVLALAGCAHETSRPPNLAQNEYRIGREDVITVEIWKDPSLSTKVPVRPDGRITLPMIGAVDAEG